MNLFRWMFWIKLKVLDILLMIRFPNLFRINGVEPTFTFRSRWGLQLPTTEILHYLMMLFDFFDIFGGIFHCKTQTSIFRFAHDLILHAAPIWTMKYSWESLNLPSYICAYWGKPAALSHLHASRASISAKKRRNIIEIASNLMNI